MPQPGTPILLHPELASVLSKGDVAALNELSDASQVRAWTQRKVEQYTKYIKALLAIRNSIAPINELPTEILQEVFAYVPVKAGWCNASWMLSLQSVCRRWRSVLLATPEYWLRGLYTALYPYSRIRYCKGPGDDEDDDSDEDKDKDVRQNRRRYLVNLFLDRSAPLPLELRVWRAPCERTLHWKIFEDHFDRVTTFEFTANDEDDFYDAFQVVATSMKRLESLELCIECESDLYYGEEFALDQWKAENLPCLRRLLTDAPLFCRAMTVPSLHAITFYGYRDIATLPGLLDALEGCPALATIHQLYFGTDPARIGQEKRVLNRIVNLPNLRSLEVLGDIPALYSFLSCLSFPLTTRIEAEIDGDIGDQFALPGILPRRISGLHTSPTIDRLYMHSQHQPYGAQPRVSMIGFVRGMERFRVWPVFCLCRARHFLQFLEVFAACTVTELALDLGPLPDDLDGDFWREFFAALPHVRRLELLSRTTQSRATKREIAEHFLASARISLEAGHGSSLAWVLHVEGSSTSHLEEELGDIEEVLQGHARQGGRLDVLELYITTTRSEDTYWSRISGVSQITTDAAASRFVTRDYVSRLAGAADNVIVGGGWGFAEDDMLNADDGENRDMGRDEDEEEEADSDDMQVV